MIRTFIVLIGFSFFIVPLISASANQTNYGQEYSSYSSIELKTAKETISNTIENDMADRCQNGCNLLAYREWGISIEANAAKGGADNYWRGNEAC